MGAVQVITTQSLPVRHYLRPGTLLRSLWTNRQLIRQLTARYVQARFRGSVLGIVWSFVLPLLMLAVYTFVFGFVIKNNKWPAVFRNDSIFHFALLLYAGLIVYAVFSETISAATSAIVHNVNYVKKVVFPLEILPVCNLGAAVVQGLISFVVLIVCAAAITRSISPTLYYLPVVLIPLVMFTLGLAWWLASLGVFLRDMGQIVSVVLQMLMFMTPIFYPIADPLPKVFQQIMRLNPLTVIVENARRVLLFGQAPDWLWLGITALISVVILQLGYIWFMKTKRGFADVI